MITNLQLKGDLPVRFSEHVAEPIELRLCKKLASLNFYLAHLSRPGKTSHVADGAKLVHIGVIIEVEYELVSVGRNSCVCGVDATEAFAILSFNFSISIYFF